MATVVSYPGVYVQEVASGVRPIAAASTSTPAFVGLAEMGPDDEAKRITSWTEYKKYYGAFIRGSYLAESVFQFFNNGGQQCYIVRVTRSDAIKAEVTIEDKIKFSAKYKGKWGNYLFLQIENGTNNPASTFKISIRIQEVMDIVPEDFLNIPPLEVHDNLSMNPDSPNYVVKVLKRSSHLIEASVLNRTNSLQRGIHRGGLNPTLPLGSNRKFEINVDHDGFQLIELPSSETAEDEEDLTKIASAIEDTVKNLIPIKNSTPQDAYSKFSCKVEIVESEESEEPAKRLILQSGTNFETDIDNESTLSSVQIQNAPTDNAATQLKLGESNGGESEDAFAGQKPSNIEIVEIGDTSIEAQITGATLGTDGSAEINELLYSNGFSHLDNKTDFSLLAVPGIGTSVMVDLGMSYCQNRSLQDVFYIGEMDRFDEQDEAQNFRTALTKPNSYGAVYFPWIKAIDPSGKSAEPILLPPSGYIAGLIARIDTSRGVWKAPAGTEASLNGAVGLATDLTDIQQGNLNRINVNCLRRFATSGIVSWGARTITSDPEYNYVPVRRMAIMIRVSIYFGIQWAVFEPNDETLWSSLRLNITSFMMTLYRKGAFQGSSPSQAFFVNCDSETTTQDDINLGIVNVLVGFAPVKPTEFVVVKISQKAGQSS